MLTKDVEPEPDVGDRLQRMAEMRRNGAEDKTSGGNGGGLNSSAEIGAQPAE